MNLQLRWQDDGIEQRKTLRGEEVIAGRDPECDAHMVHDSVSRKHARFFQVAGRWRVVDLGSTNGVFVNDEPADSDVFVDPGDIVHVGRLRVEVLEAPDIRKPGATGPRRGAAYFEDPAHAQSLAEATRVIQQGKTGGRRTATTVLRSSSELQEAIAQAEAAVVPPPPQTLRDRWQNRPRINRIRDLIIILFLVVGLLWVLAAGLKKGTAPKEEIPAGPAAVTPGEPAVPPPPIVPPAEAADPAAAVPTPVETAPLGPVIVVQTVPPGLEIWVDGKLQGRTSPDPKASWQSLPLRLTEVPAGIHELRARYGFAAGPVNSVALKDGKETQLSLRMWLPNLLVETFDGRILYAMLVGREDDAVLLATSPTDTLRLTRREIKTQRATVPAVLRQEDDGRVTNRRGDAEAPELTVDPFPEEDLR